MDDALRIGNLDPCFAQRCAHSHSDIALHKRKLRNLLGSKAKHEDKRVFAELL
jgi:hypothetical protein